jgi:hypothetical protein
MKDSIYTIPISEVFEPKCGCPLCALYKTLEERWVEYITGAAMMEPDVRVETNRHGFCARHFEMMLGQRNRLSVALILQTRLAWIDENLDTAHKASLFRKEEILAEGDCFVCGKIDAEFRRIGGNIAAVWAKEQDFRDLYAAQEFLCHPHATLLLAAGNAALKGASRTAFAQATAALTRKKLREVKENIDAFCTLFDYRNAHGGQPDKQVAAAVERAIAYLTSGGEKEESSEKS